MATPGIPHLLILEPDSRGHAREWIGHLIQGAHALGARGPRLTFAVPSALAEEIAPHVPCTARGRIGFVALTPREASLCLSDRLAVSGMARWWTMRRCLDRAGATHGLFLEFDHLSLPLALGLNGGGRPLSGILFRPSVHYGEIGPYRPTGRERLRDLRKQLLYRFVLRNPGVAAMLTLDPYFVTHARRAYANGIKVAEAPDPAFPLPEPAAGVAAPWADIPEERRLLVLFGELTERKGLPTLLDSLLLLPAGDAERLAVIVAGRIDARLTPEVEARAVRLARERPQLWLRFENRRLPAGELAALLRRCCMVLAPYQRFVGSSGIVLWAAGAEKPVLCQDYGLLGRLVRDHGLGVVTDSTDPSALAACLREIARGTLPPTPDTRAMGALCAARTPERFARTVLEHALSGCANTPLPTPPHGQPRSITSMLCCLAAGALDIVL